mmetsp:Transcript_46372/g.132703  ORF Transcript_46372/g.132703 Transcript_46372/m.132703 type:complete len:550 (-) Transcript_46372:83-1732(-)
MPFLPSLRHIIFVAVVVLLEARSFSAQHFRGESAVRDAPSSATDAVAGGRSSVSSDTGGSGSSREPSFAAGSIVPVEEQRAAVQGTRARCNHRCRAVQRILSHAELGAAAATPLGAPAGRRQLRSLRASETMPAWDASQGVCVPPGAALPASWAPSTELQKKLANISIAGNLSSAAEAAARGAYSELVDFIGRAGMREKLGTDALESTINGAFAGSNMPDIQTHALAEGTDILLELAAPYLDPQQDSREVGKCSELQDGDLATLVSYALYIKQQAPHNATVDFALERLENATNLALVACGTLQELLGFEPSSRLGKLPISAEDAVKMTSIDRVYGMVLQEVDLIGLLANPRLQMPNGTSDYVADFWNYLSRYPFPGFSDYNASQLYNFDQNSYVVTHIPYIVTGEQRHEIYVSDAPWLFSYLRENFYAAMENTEHDLLAEFVDNLRQYGCTEENDAQTRDGTRYLLGLYKDAGNRWMNVLAPDEIDGEKVSAYSTMHKAWTAYVGLHRRVFEAPGPETYQRAAREMLALSRARGSPSGDGSAGAGQLRL